MTAALQAIADTRGQIHAQRATVEKQIHEATALLALLKQQAAGLDLQLAIAESAAAIGPALSAFEEALSTR